MINKTRYKLFHLIVNTVQYIDCAFVDRKENILMLQNPHLLYVLAVNDTVYGFNSTSISLSNDLVNIHTGHLDHDISTSTKFDKKTKNNILLDDDISSKKNKIVNRKKKRNRIQLDNDDVLIDQIEDNNSIEPVATDVLKLALLRPIKAKKQTKKNKSKVSVISANQSSINKNTNEQESISDTIIITRPLTVQELSSKIQVSEAAIITWLFLQGISVTINQVVDVNIATKVAQNYNFNVINSENNLDNNSINNYVLNTSINRGFKRSPIITIFGHVDHGKTTLLDYIRKTNLAGQEPGGITQSIVGYEVDYNYMNSIEKLIFVDTPGHEAFACMRSRGAEVTDVAILVVAADDGLKPQTIEAINHIISREIPYIIAINKVDKPDIKIDKVKEQLSQYGIQDENWGGKSLIINISALTGTNVNLLLSHICELSNSLNLQANLDTNAEGIIIEAYLDKAIGAIATVVIKNGTLKIGDIVVSGHVYGRVKSILDSSSKKRTSISASSIAQICGFSSIPQTGLKFNVVSGDKEAKNLCANNMKSKYVYAGSNLLNTRVTWENTTNDNNIKKVNLILKADTHGSMEAILNAFSQISQNKVQINLISCALGSVFDKDIDLAVTSNSIILGFNIDILNNIRSTANKLNVTIEKFNVIYDLLDYMNQYMISLVDPEYDKISIGQASVQTVFNINKGSVAGCFVNVGCLRRGSYIVVYRNQSIVYEGILSSLKHLKDNVDEVVEGNECGVMCNYYDSWQKLDLIQAFEIIERKKVL